MPGSTDELEEPLAEAQEIEEEPQTDEEEQQESQSDLFEDDMEAYRT